MFKHLCNVLIIAQHHMNISGAVRIVAHHL